MKSERFGRWRLDSYEADFSPMLFGPDQECIEVRDGGLVLTDMSRAAWVPEPALDALREAHHFYEANRKPAAPALQDATTK